MDFILLLLIALAVLAGIFLYFNKPSRFDETKVSPAVPPVNNDPPVVNQEVINVKAGEAVTVVSPLDVNQDGKVDLKDAVEVVKKTRARVKKAADTDGDGKVTVKDVKKAVSKSKTKVVKAVKSARGRKAAK